jgi:hypothetical protein
MHKSEKKVAMHVLTAVDNGVWVAQAVEFNLFAQAKDFDSLKEEFMRVVRLHIDCSEKRGVEPFVSLKPAPGSTWLPPST